MHEYLQAIITVLALVNPMVCTSMFVTIEAGQARSLQFADASKTSLAVMVILLLAAILGIKILGIFGVSLDAFSVAGGGVLAWIGFGMLKGSADDAHGQQSSKLEQRPVLSPVIMFAASPGTITGVITLASNHTRDAFPITAMVAVCAVSLVMWLGLLMSIKFDGQSRKGFVRDTVTRFMGLIVIAMGIQFALTGIKAFFGPVV